MKSVLPCNKTEDVGRRVSVGWLYCAQASRPKSALVKVLQLCEFIWGGYPRLLTHMAEN